MGSGTEMGRGAVQAENRGSKAPATSQLGQRLEQRVIREDATSATHKKGKIWEEEASHLKKLEAGKRRLTNSMESEQGGILTVDELERIGQYQVPMAIEPHTLAGCHIATKVASEWRRKRPSDVRERSPRPKKRSWNQDPV